MLTKVRMVLFTLFAVSLGFLAYYAYAAGSMSISESLLITPKDPNTAGKTHDSLEDLVDRRFVYTYETSKSTNVKTDLSSSSAYLKSVNSSYAAVTRLPMKSGAFFTASSEENKVRHAVINAALADDLYGGYDITGTELTIDGSKYEVTGVIADGSDDKNVYVSGALTDERPNSFMALLEQDNGITVMFVESILKQSGISSDSYDYIPAGNHISVIVGKLVLAATIIGLAAGVFVFIKLFRLFIVQFRRLRLMFKQLYLLEMLTKRLPFLLGITGVLLSLCGIIAAAYWTFLKYVYAFMELDPMGFVFDFTEKSGQTGFSAFSNSLISVNMGSTIALICFFEIILLYVFTLIRDN